MLWIILEDFLASKSHCQSLDLDCTGQNCIMHLWDALCVLQITTFFFFSSEKHALLCFVLLFLGFCWGQEGCLLDLRIRILRESTAAGCFGFFLCCSWTFAWPFLFIILSIWLKCALIMGALMGFMFIIYLP